MLRTFLDEDGRLRSIPVSHAKRAVVLEYLADQLEAGRSYRERELNAVLRRFHDDVATLRRELVGAKLVVRTTDGVYKLTCGRTTKMGEHAIGNAMESTLGPPLSAVTRRPSSTAISRCTTTSFKPYLKRCVRPASTSWPSIAT